MSETEEQERPFAPVLKDLVGSAELGHKDLRADEYWRGIPAYADLNGEEFHDHRFQSRNSVTSVKKLREVLGGLVPEAFYRDVEEGLFRSPMSLRISPYLMSLIDWTQPDTDPLRIQFLPLAEKQ